MKKITQLFFIGTTLFISSISLGQQIYDNGGISTGPQTSAGIDAPAGYEWSELQLPNTILGSGSVFNNAGTSDFALADDFTVPAGESWDITSANFYVYQTNYAGTTIPADVIRVRIWDGDPSLPTSTIVFGDMTTNVLNDFLSEDALVYRRATTTTTPLVRKIWRINTSFTTTLAAGTYWIEHQFHATNDGAMFEPAVTVLDELSNPEWNAKQRSVATWTNLSDTGSTFSRAVSFQLNGTINTLSVNQNIFENIFSISPNPVNREFSIHLSSDVPLNYVEIVGIDGKVIKTITQQFDAIDTQDLASGNYFVKIYTEKGIAVKKIIKL